MLRPRDVPARWPFVLRGWLIVVALLIALTIGQLTLAVAYSVDALDAARWSPRVVMDGIDNGAWFAIYTAMSVLMLVAWLGVGVLFVRRSRRFPGALTVLLVWWFAALGLTVAMFGIRDVTLLLQFLALVLVTSYVRRSRRVKATFVN